VRRDDERSGVVNIGIEGMMLTSAFMGFMTALVIHESGPPAQPSAVFGMTPALVGGLIAAMVTGMLVSALHAWLSISVRADQIISGTVINIIALGSPGTSTASSPRPGARARSSRSDHRRRSPSSRSSAGCSGCSWRSGRSRCP
jgi:ABC-type uncharacterized transport system permease subunit